MCHLHITCIKVEYHASVNSLENSEKIVYVGQRLMYPINKKTPYHASFFLNAITFLGFTLEIVVFNRKYIAKITNPITKPHFYQS